MSWHVKRTGSPLSKGWEDLVWGGGAGTHQEARGIFKASRTSTGKATHDEQRIRTRDGHGRQHSSRKGSPLVGSGSVPASVGPSRRQGPQAEPSANCTEEPGHPLETSARWAAGQEPAGTVGQGFVRTPGESSSVAKDRLCGSTPVEKVKPCGDKGAEAGRVRRRPGSPSPAGAAICWGLSPVGTPRKQEVLGLRPRLRILVSHGPPGLRQ